MCHMGIRDPPSNQIIWHVPCVWSWNLEIIDLLKMSAYDIMPCGNLCYTCMTHGILLFVGHPTYVKLNQSKEMNYKVKRNWKYVENVKIYVN
jgi:hypothetical protein